MRDDAKEAPAWLARVKAGPHPSNLIRKSENKENCPPGLYTNSDDVPHFAVISCRTDTCK